MAVEKLELKSDLLVHLKMQAATPVRVRVTNQRVKTNKTTYEAHRTHPTLAQLFCALS